MSKPSIEWSRQTINPVTGCTRISPGCDHCYAAAFANRGLNIRHKGLTRRTAAGTDWTGEIRLHEDLISRIGSQQKPNRIFINSMSDLFHERVPLEFIRDIIEACARHPRHVFQALTKRADRLLELAPVLPWPNNFHMGVTVENADYLWRLDLLRQVPAAVRFVSLEPLLGPVPELDLTGIHWVICGGESGPKARPMKAEWVREIRDKCIAAGVPFFFKQHGSNPGNNPDPHDPTARRNGGLCKGGRTLDGQIWDEHPDGHKCDDHDNEKE